MKRPGPRGNPKKHPSDSDYPSAPKAKRPTRTGNTKTLGIIVCAFFGFILLSSTIFFAIPPPTPQGMEPTAGTPADNYPMEQRDQFCGMAPPRSNNYIEEFEIPTACSQPLSLVVAPDGGVWFAQTNTGNLARFDPADRTFEEFENPHWDSTQTSMMWGMDYADGRIWYTDEANDSVWRFDVSSGEYLRLPINAPGDALPQILRVIGPYIVLNDLTGNALVVLEASDPEGGLVYNDISSTVPDGVTAGFTVDRGGLMWYTTWNERVGGLLLGVDLGLEGGDPVPGVINATLPPGLRTPNGIAVDHNGDVWLADTSSSFFFKYDRASGNFTNYVTSPPDVLSYGNATGMVGNPLSRPYWMETSDDGMLVFNEQTANRIGVMDPRTERLVEYSIPSRNPLWADCFGDPLCGLSQALSIAVDGPRVWFTEWVENNVGVLDTSIPLPFDIVLETPRVSVAPGESVTVSYAVESARDRVQILEPTASGTRAFLSPQFHEMRLYQLDGRETLTLDLAARADAQPGEYKVLLGGRTGEVTVSKFLTVDIRP